jgi:CheY-like chemotaxis protein
MRRDNLPGFPTVLVAANDRKIRQAFAAELQREQCLVLAAGNAEEAVRFVVSHSRPIHVLLIDVNMDGIELSAQLSRYRPHMQIVLFSERPENTRGALQPEEAIMRAGVLLGIGQSSSAVAAVPIRRTSKSPDLRESHPLTPKIAC